MIILEDIEQGTEAWKEARLGVATASNFDLILTSKGEASKSAQKYMHRLAGERVSGICEESYSNANMERGVQLEADARSFYELTNGVDVKTVGLVYLDESKRVACSPDGLIGDDGLIEIKCPTIAVHVSYLLDNKLPTEYFQQCQGQLFVTGRKWLDFVSYFPSLRPLVIRVQRDEAFISKLSEALASFCKELDSIVEKIK